MQKRILQITNKPAYPSIDGGCLGMAKMSDFYNANKNYSLDILTTETYKHPFEIKEFKKTLSNEIPIYSVFLDTKPTFFEAFFQYFGEKSYVLSRFYSKQFESKILNLLSENQYDIIQFENIFVAQYFEVIQKNSKAKLILNSANVEYEIWERLRKKSSFLKNIYFKKQAKQLKKEEIFIWKNMQGIISATDKDKAQIELKTNKNIPIITIPFYLNITKYKVRKNQKISAVSFFHIGAMDWLPNIEGVTWFVNKVWNQGFKNEKHTLNLAGKSMPKSIVEKVSKNIHVAGFVDNAKQFMAENDVMIVPLFSGSGIRVKIIEAMAMGKCVISTTIGAEGINYTEKENILLANNSEEFASNMNFLIKNPAKITEIGKNARLFVEKEHTLSLMENKLESLFNSIS